MAMLRRTSRRSLISGRINLAKSVGQASPQASAAKEPEIRIHLGHTAANNPPRRRPYQSPIWRERLKCRRPAILTGATAKARTRDALKRPQRNHPRSSIPGQPSGPSSPPRATRTGSRQPRRLWLPSFKGWRWTPLLPAKYSKALSTPIPRQPVAQSSPHTKIGVRQRRQL